jgi:hypothetical protein
VTYDGSGGVAGIDIWVNGELPTQRVAEENIVPAVSTSILGHATVISGIGFDREFYSYTGGDAPVNFFGGEIDELLIYDKALIAPQIITRYNNGFGTETLVYGTTY